METTRSYPSEPSEKSRGVALALATILGPFGAHRFYAGKTGTGVLMAVTIGGLGVWYLYDLILVASGSFRDIEGRLIRRWDPEETAPLGPGSTEVLEELEFAWRQIEGVPVDRGDVAEPVEGELSVAQHVEPGGAAPAVERADPRQQLVEAEGLGEVIIRAGVEAPHDILGGVERGEHEDRGRPALPAQLGGDLEAVLLRQHDVEQDDVVVVDMRQHRGLVPVGGDVHRVSFLLQSLFNEARDLPVVFDDEYPHVTNLSCTVEGDCKRS